MTRLVTIFLGGILLVLLFIAGLFAYNTFHPQTPATSTTSGSSEQGTTPSPTQTPQWPVVSNPSGTSLPCTDASCSPYQTQDNATVICSGDVSVKEPNGTLHSPDGVGTDGEEVAISAGGYTIIFTNSASCKRYPKLSSSFIHNILVNLAEGQKASGCNGGCTGSEQTWIFP